MVGTMAFPKVVMMVVMMEMELVEKLVDSMDTMLVCFEVVQTVLQMVASMDTQSVVLMDNLLVGPVVVELVEMKAVSSEYMLVY